MRNTDPKRSIEICYLVLKHVKDNRGEISASRLRAYTKDVMLADGFPFSDNRRDSIINALMVTMQLQRIRNGRQTRYLITEIGEVAFKVYRKLVKQ